MDFLTDIVKEIGDDFTQLAADIDDTEQYVDTGSYIFNGLVSGSIFGGVSGNKITAIAGLFLASQWLRIFWTLILMDIACILILRQLSISHS
jgi:hypothetical protein